MQISLDVVEGLAPDQASLNAAKKLLKPAKWPLRGKAPSLNSIWGQCQGSGSKPYYVMADVVDYGYKCTCPSRKFPCKHVLALLWQFAEDAGGFEDNASPEWVNDWLGRRRKSSGAKKETSNVNLDKNIHNTHADTPPTEAVSQAERAKKAATQEKRAKQNKLKTDAAVALGLQEFQQWVNDQLEAGIGLFLKEISQHCRRIAARLVDAKATNLASRLDELPAKVLALPKEEQAEKAFKELGQLVLLTHAWLINPDDADARRAIITAENKDQVLQQDSVLRLMGTWEQVGEKIMTRRDGLVSHETWLLTSQDDQPVFAQLLDHYPVSAGQRKVGLTAGARLEGELVYYPSRSPTRAFILEHKMLPHEQSPRWPIHKQEFWPGYQQRLKNIPWLEDSPYLLNDGRIAKDSSERYWWQDDKQELLIPLSNVQVPQLLLGAQLQSSFVVWDGDRAELFSAQTQEWGMISC